MRPVLYSEDTTNYSTNGLGILLDTLTCEVYEEYNGSFELTIEYAADGPLANEITNGKQILAKPNDVDDPHAFRVYEVEKDLEAGSIFARATSITDDLGGNLIVEASVSDVNAQSALNTIKSNLIEPTIFDFVSDIQTSSSASWSRINPLNAIVGSDGSIVDYWSGDIKRTNNTIYLYSRRGKDKVVTIRPGKNIDGFNMTVSDKGVKTKILPYYQYVPEELPTYELVEDYDGNMVKQAVYSQEVSAYPEPTVVTGNVVTSANAANFANQRYSPVDFSQDAYINELVSTYIQTKRDEAANSPEIVDTSNFENELKNYIINVLNQEASKYFTHKNPGSDEPKVDIKVDMLQLSDSPEWERFKDLELIQLTDTVEVYVKEFDVDVEVKINSIQYDSIGERVIKITAGNIKTSLTQSTENVYKQQTKELKEYIETLENGVYNSITRTASGKNRSFRGYTEPPASVSSEGDMWFKEVGNGVVESYIYNGGVWIPVISESVIADMEQGISDAQTTADTAESKAQSTIDNINSVVTTNGFTTLEDLFASKIGDEEFSTMFFQESKAIGLVWNNNGVDEAIIMIDELGKPYIKGENIILDGDTIVDGTFTVTDTMLAPDAVIKKLIADGIDANEVRITNLDVNNIVGGDLELTRGFRITNNGVPVLEVDAVTGEVKMTASNVATKQELQEIELTPGPEGKTAYEVAVESGFVGSQTEWLASLIGPQGPQGLEGPKGDQGIQGPEGESSYTHIAYATDANGENFSTNHFAAATYIGIYVNNSILDSSNYLDYKWTLIKGTKGDQGIPGAKGDDGLTPYFHTAWATNSTGTSGFSTTASLGKTYIGTYTDYMPQDSTDPSVYNWVLIKGEKGDQGPQGVQGPAGADGQSQWTHIRYSANSSGNPMVDNPTSGTNYIGLVVTTSSVAPTSYSTYTWQKFVGEDGVQGPQGIQGPAGADGDPTYTWIKYADSPTTGMSDNPAGKDYIGIAYNKSTATESSNYGDYAWSLFKGPQGATGERGPKGDTGTSVNGVTEHYLATSASSGITSSSSGWTTTMQEMTATNKYLWNYELISFSDGSTQATIPVIIGVYGEKGDAGTDGADGVEGRSVTGITEYYLASSASSGVTRSTTGWTTGLQLTSPTKRYLWNYEKISWSTEPTTTYVEPIVIGIHGEKGDTGAQGPQGVAGLEGPKGDQGIQGPKGDNGLSSYTHIAYATGTSGQNFSTSHFASATYIGMYVDNTPTDSDSHTSYAWSLIKGADGAQGIQGPKGDDGQTPYFHTAWATNSTGTSGFSTTISTGKTYIGTYTDYTSADSTDPSKYSWVLIKGDKGDQGIQGPPGANGVSQYVHIRYSANSNGSSMTTTPQSNTAYIGMVTTTSSTAPTAYTSYVWSLFKGPQGATGSTGPQGPQGIQGPQGTDGQTTYTWVRYADDENGSGMSNYPDGKRYVGMAFNKTTATESNTASDYNWSPLYDNVQVGGRNLLPNTDFDGIAKRYNKPAGGTTEGGFKFTPTVQVESGIPYTLSLKIRGKANVNFYQLNTGGNIAQALIVRANLSETDYKLVTLTFTVQIVRTLNQVYICTAWGNTPDGDWFEIEPNSLKLEKGNVATDWTPAPEDVEADYNDKIVTLREESNATVEQMADQILSTVQTTYTSESQFETKVQELTSAINQTAESLELSFSETVQAVSDNLVGVSTEVDTIKKNVVASAEGVELSSNNSQMRLKIQEDRISFMQGTTEVAYISNETMQITHGIFVQSAQIGEHKIETISGGITVFSWMG